MQLFYTTGSHGGDRFSVIICGLSFGKESMRQPKTISMIKATARERLIGRYGTTIWATIILLFIQIIISDIVISMINPGTIITYAIYIFATILVDILFGVFYSGVAYLYMNVTYAQPVRVSDIFHGFASHPDKAIIIQIPFALASAVQSIPLVVIRTAGLLNPAQMNRTLYAAMIFTACAGTVLSIIVNIVYSQGYYLLQDFPDRSAIDILKTSAGLMKGNKWRLVKMYLSFIPLILLGMITFFVPLFWVDSYIESSRAAFYQDCISVAAQNGNRGER